MEMLVKIEWEDPTSQHYVYPVNISRALSRFFNDIPFKVTEVKPTTKIDEKDSILRTAMRASG